MIGRANVTGATFAFWRGVASIKSTVRSLALLCLVPVACERSAPPLPAELSPEEPDVLFNTVTGPPSTHSFRIINTGGTRTEYLAVELRGDVDAFSITDDECTAAQVEPNAWCIVTVALTADDAGSYAAQLHVGDAAGNVYADVAMSGRVSDASLSIDPPQPTPVVEGDVGTTRVAVTNGGGARTGALTVTAPGATLDNDTCSGHTLVGGGSCQFIVRYAAPFGSLGDTKLRAAVTAEGGDHADSDLVFTATRAPGLVLGDVDFTTIDPIEQAGVDFTISNPTASDTGPLTVTLADESPTPAPVAPFQIDHNRDLCSGVSVPAHGSCHLEIMTALNLPVPGIYTMALSASGPFAHVGTGVLKVSTALMHGTITLAKGGTGDGSVGYNGTPNPLCVPGNATCASVTILDGESVAFTATPATGSVFTKWDAGPCTGSSNAVCTFKGANHASFALDAVFDKP